MDIQSTLKTLGINPKNAGSAAGLDWINSQDNPIASINPANGELIAKVFSTNNDDYEAIVKKAAETFKTWRMIPAPKRGELIRQLGDALREKKDALGMLVTLECGKSYQEGKGEVQEMIDMADLAVGQSRMLYGNTMHSERPEHRMYEQWHPLGVVGVISAFNFPVAVWAWNAFLAIICGNTVVWRPSPKTPLCAIAVQNICNDVMKANGYDGLFSLVISEDIELSKKFVADERMPLMSFTGSSAVGRLVGEAVAKRFGRPLLELSGNNALIVDEYADLKLALPAIVFGAVGTAGQRCTTTRRVFVHESLKDKLIDNLVNAYKSITIGDPLDEKNLMGPLIDEEAVQHYEKAIAELNKQNAEVLCGGKRIDRKGFYVEPTIAIAENDWDIVQHETFAPILYLMPYKDLDDAITMQNNVKQGLSSAIFTENIKHAERFLAHSGSDCGIANVNIGTSGAEIGGAFGGEKETGGGREAGSDAWKAYMRRQTNTINWSDELPLAQGIKFNL